MATEVFHYLQQLMSDAGIPASGVIHVGAHRGQELPHYTEFDKVVLVEPLPECAEHLRTIDPFAEVIEAAVASHRDGATLHVTRFDQQSSILPPAKLPVDRAIRVQTLPLRAIQALNPGCNVLVADCQGSELDVLRSGDLGALDMVIVETTAKARYQGGATRDDVLGFMLEAGWRRIAEYHHKPSSHISDCVLVRRCSTH